jgi:hypothetical protein
MLLFFGYQFRAPHSLLPPSPRPFFLTYGDFRFLSARTSFAAAISGLVMSFSPNVCELEVLSELVNGFFTASLSFSVVVFWSELLSSSVDVEVDVEVEVSGAIGSMAMC